MQNVQTIREPTPRNNSRRAVDDTQSRDFKDAKFMLYLIDDNRPLNSGEREGFKNFLREFQEYTPPSRTKLMEMIHTYSAELRRKLKVDLQETDYISLTCDGWTQHHIKYIGITIHYIKDGKMCNGLLCFEKCTNQTSENIVNFMNEKLREFDIAKDKIISITTDNASNMILAQRQFGAKLVLIF